MNRLVKFFNLPSSDRRLLIKTFVIVSAVRLGLWVLPFRTLRVLLRKLEKRRFSSARNGLQRPMHRLLWAVKTTSPVIPAATCLTQALATKLLFCRAGYQATLRIGVTKSQSGELLAHAWLESNGKIVVGYISDLSRYTNLPPLLDESR